MNAPQAIEIAATDLDNNGGVFCPSPKAGMALWNTHPKVYIHVAAKGEGQCPYCGTVYRLNDKKAVISH